MIITTLRHHLRRAILWAHHITLTRIYRYLQLFREEDMIAAYKATLEKIIQDN